MPLGRGRVEVKAHTQESRFRIYGCALFPGGIRITCVAVQTQKTKQGNGKLAQTTIDPVEVAEEAGLRYVSDEQPGYTRKGKGKSFQYFDTPGRVVSGVKSPVLTWRPPRHTPSSPACVSPLLTLRMLAT